MQCSSSHPHQSQSTLIHPDNHAPDCNSRSVGELIQPFKSLRDYVRNAVFTSPQPDTDNLAS